jgi:hypothetical protein
MKKKIFSLWILLAACAISLSSCSSDSNDDDSGSDMKSGIVGVWETTHIKGNYWDENENDITVDEDVSDSEKGRFQFLSDGSCKLYKKLSNSWFDSLFSDGTYTITGSSISIYDGAKLYGTFTVTSLKNNTATFEYYLEDSTKPTYLTLIRVE